MLSVSPNNPTDSVKPMKETKGSNLKRWKSPAGLDQHFLSTKELLRDVRFLILSIFCGFCRLAPASNRGFAPVSRLGTFVSRPPYLYLFHKLDYTFLAVQRNSVSVTLRCIGLYTCHGCAALRRGEVRRRKASNGTAAAQHGTVHAPHGTARLRTAPQPV